jgi:hypothetical protein
VLSKSSTSDLTQRLSMTAKGSGVREDGTPDAR